MSAAASPTYTIAANVRWFAVVFLVITTILELLSFGMMQLGVDVSNVTWISSYAGAVAPAGLRFAGRRPDWDSHARHQLALCYFLVAGSMNALLAAAYFLIDPSFVSDWLDIVAEVGFWVIPTILILAAFFDYAVARFVLRLIAQWKSNESTRERESS